MSKRLIDRIPFKKIVVVLAIALGVSLGLCGITSIVPSGRSSDFSAILGLIAFGVSIAGLMLTFAVYVTLSIFGGSGEEVSQSVVPREEPDDTKSDKHE
ncbi:MAG: hypothetical protein P4K93_03390 [Terracidiphilus sp.]|nr:hypothetical protein [Terracidiphilus sp.]MDR3797168.1 hypothetical protein [Terracidiphilus sp.]